MIKKNNQALIVGGSNGLGLSITKCLLDKDYECIYILDKNNFPEEHMDKRIKFLKNNLVTDDYLDDVKKIIDQVDTLIITAGVGRMINFDNINIEEIDITMNVNTISLMKIIKIAYYKIRSKNDFFTVIISSIAGLLSSPMYSIYSASKAAVHKFVEAINCELECEGFKNRILNVSPGRIIGTSFHNQLTNLDILEELTNTIVHNMFNRELLYIPSYEETYKTVLEKYMHNPNEFSRNSYEYKLGVGLEKSIKYKVGFLSGTFDMFHIGHLNLLRRAKQFCDYLVVGVHKDGSHKNIETTISFDSRVEILKSIKYVDKVIESKKEDSDVYFDIINYDFLFVGSDYKGTKRFENYEKILNPFGVKIIYLPYTQGISSTDLRNVINKKNNIKKKI